MLPVFLDVHSIGTTTEEDLMSSECTKRWTRSKVGNILYNFEGGTIYCLLDAPNKEAVEKHHGNMGCKIRTGLCKQKTLYKHELMMI